MNTSSPLANVLTVQHDKQAAIGPTLRKILPAVLGAAAGSVYTDMEYGTAPEWMRLNRGIFPMNPDRPVDPGEKLMARLANMVSFGAMPGLSKGMLRGHKHPAAFNAALVGAVASTPLISGLFDVTSGRTAEAVRQQLAVPKSLGQRASEWALPAAATGATLLGGVALARELRERKKKDAPTQMQQDPRSRGTVRVKLPERVGFPAAEIELPLEDMRLSQHAINQLGVSVRQNARMKEKSRRERLSKSAESRTICKLLMDKQAYMQADTSPGVQKRVQDRTTTDPIPVPQPKVPAVPPPPQYDFNSATTALRSGNLSPADRVLAAQPVLDRFDENLNSAQGFLAGYRANPTQEGFDKFHQDWQALMSRMPAGSDGRTWAMQHDSKAFAQNIDTMQKRLDNMRHDGRSSLRNTLTGYDPNARQGGAKNPWAPADGLQQNALAMADVWAAGATDAPRMSYDTRPAPSPGARLFHGGGEFESPFGKSTTPFTGTPPNRMPDYDKDPNNSYSRRSYGGMR